MAFFFLLGHSDWLRAIYEIMRLIYWEMALAFQPPPLNAEGNCIKIRPSLDFVLGMKLEGCDRGRGACSVLDLRNILNCVTGVQLFITF